MGVTQVAVLGAGNGGCAAAADLSRRGFAVRLYNRTRERLQPMIERGGIELSGKAGEGFVELALITDDLAAAVRGAEVVVVTVPTSAFPQYAPALAEVVSPEQVVFLNPGHMGGSLFFANAIRQRKGRSDVRLCETATLTYACRMQGPAAVRIFNVATNLLFAAFPGKYLDECYERVSPLFPQIARAGSVLETGLIDLNAVEHPAQILCNAGRVEHTGGDFYFYFEGTTPAVSRLIEAVDAERIALTGAAGVPTRSFVDFFAAAGYTTAEAAATGSVYRAMQASEANRWIKSPPSLDHRYVHEDVGWGLVPYAELAHVLGVPTPAMDALITLAAYMNGVDYRTRGLTLERMGLAGLDRDALASFLWEGRR